MGSAKTLRKRAQRKRKKAREKTTPIGKETKQPTLPVRPVSPTSKEGSKKQIESLSYESAIIATQLRKAGNTYGASFPRHDPVIQDTTRAKKILEGFLKENDQRIRHEQERF